MKEAFSINVHITPPKGPRRRHLLTTTVRPFGLELRQLEFGHIPRPVDSERLRLNHLPSYLRYRHRIETVCTQDTAGSQVSVTFGELERGV